jgi:cold shock CspA family protein
MSRGFGFIVNAEGKDVFVHFTASKATASAPQGQEKVEYEETGGPKGLSASVRRLKSPSSKFAPASVAWNRRRQTPTSPPPTTPPA